MLYAPMLVAALLSAPAEPPSQVAQGGPLAACRPTAVAHALLREELGQQPLWAGLGPDGRTAVELWQSPAGQWTLVVTTVNGVSCFQLGGHSGQTPPRGKG